MQFCNYFCDLDYIVAIERHAKAVLPQRDQLAASTSPRRFDDGHLQFVRGHNTAATRVVASDPER
jgi:hypothetical protein